MTRRRTSVLFALVASAAVLGLLPVAATAMSSGKVESICRQVLETLGVTTDYAYTAPGGKAAIHWTARGAVATFGSSSTSALVDTRGYIHVVDFDADTAEGVEFKGVMPESYGGGPLTIDLEWGATSADSGDFRVSVAVQSTTPGVDDPDAYDLAPAITQSLTSTGSLTIYNETYSLTNAEADDIGAGEQVLIRVIRDAASGGGTPDDAGGDWELRNIWLTED